MPVITIAMHEGRSVDQKRALVKGIAEVVAQVAKVSINDVDVIIEEVKRENWSSGGVLSSDKRQT